MRRATAAVLSILASVLVHAEVSVETVARGLSNPWSLAFLPNGDMLVTERAGRLRILRDGELDDTPIGGLPDIYVAGQGGLLDVILDPDFEANRILYLSYASGSRRANSTTVIKAELRDHQLHDVEEIFRAEPGKRGPYHFGGRMVFLPDNTLLLTVGDGDSTPEEAQNLKSHLGTVVRIHRDGSVPEDNPFVGREDALPHIWSYGHRNPQAILYDAEREAVYSHEHGPKGGDELNRVEKGVNYGWPEITYGREYDNTVISNYTQKPGMEQPIVYWVPSIAPAGMSVYRGALFPEWDGDFLVASLAERTLRHADFEDGAVTGQQIIATGIGRRLRDVRVGPDGAVYVLTDERRGKLLRLTPAAAGE